MSLKDKFKSLWSGIVIKRGPEQVVDRKTFYLTDAFIAFCAGFLLGLIVTIFMSTMEHEQMQLISDIILYSVLALGVAGNIYYLWPLFRSQEDALWVKIVRPILGILLFAAILIVGMYAFVFLMVVLFLFVVIKVIFFFLREDSRKKYKLDTGVIVEKDMYGNWCGDDGCRYTRNSDGSFTKE